MEDKELLAQLQRRFECKTSTDLAAVLGVSSSYLSQIRAGHLTMSVKVRLRALDKLGYVVARDALLSVTPKKIKSTLKKIDNLRAVKKVDVDDDDFKDLHQAITRLKAHHSSSEILQRVKGYLA
jgi:transcriptional regulator with XRE-family HTH domain